MKRGVGLLGAAILACGLTSASNAETRKITEAEKKFCAQAYHTYCGKYGLESTALRDCMNRNGRSLSQNCIEALIDAGSLQERSRTSQEKR
jgi:hypothetical protein